MSVERLSSSAQPPLCWISHVDLLAFNLGVVRLQSDAFESELKVRQKERVPSRFDTRLWLYRLRGRVESGAFRFK